MLKEFLNLLQYLLIGIQMFEVFNKGSFLFLFIYRKGASDVSL
jgi:hypothetical protein